MAGRIEDNLPGERLRAAAATAGKAILAEINDVLAISLKTMDHRKTSKAPVQLHRGKIPRALDERVGRGIGHPPKRRRILVAQVELRFV